jgi:gluconolactonase
MRTENLVLLAGCAALVWVPVTIAQAPPAAPLPQMAPFLVPVHAVDLMTPEGSALFGAQWKSMEGKIVEGPAIANAMPGYKTSYDIQPHAGERGFDDSSWPVIGAKGLADRRGGGRVSFLWYRANLTVPAKLGDFDTAGATAVLTIYVDDYAEVWVNGQIARRTGYPSPATIQGFNIPNRVVLADPVKPGDKFEIAVFGINGPISIAPMNFVFFREAKVEFFR